MIKEEVKFATGEDEDAYDNYLSSCLMKEGNMSNKSGEKKILNGLGR
jgi:hypothetical protein